MLNKNGNIVITGGTGFLGRAVCKELYGKKYRSIIPVNSQDYDLRLCEEVKTLYVDTQPDVVIHLAATVGGIGANKENPGRFIYENLVMGTHLIEEARINEIDKFIMVGTVCSYPKFTPVPFKEEDLWNGYPEETNAPYGIAKKTLMQMVISYKEQYGLNGVNLLPVNMYGPNDNFDPQSSHVIPALILKFHEAMQDFPHKDVEVWGTGKASREFLYVNDCAKAIVMAMEKHNDPQPVNVGTNREITIHDLVNLIATKMEYNGKIIFDPSKPDGQPRRCLDTTKAKELFVFEAETSFSEGLEKTIEWFKKQCR